MAAASEGLHAAALALLHQHLHTRKRLSRQQMRCHMLTCLPAVLDGVQDTGERLRAAEELILEGRSYLAARSTLRDMF